MNDIEKYAVNLVGHLAAANIVEEEFDPDDALKDEKDWRESVDLVERMANAIQNNPEAFLAWYRSIAPAVAE